MTELGIDPEALVAAFNRHWTWYPEQQQKGVDTLITLRPRAVGSFRRT